MADSRRSRHRAKKWKAATDVLLAALLASAALQLSPIDSHRVAAIDTPAYWSPVYRDSVAKYAGRLATYQAELYSYDMGMSAAMLPVAGEAYVNRPITGIAFSVARLGSLSASVVGAVRLIKGSPNTPLDIGLLAGGLVGVVLFSKLISIGILGTTALFLYLICERALKPAAKAPQRVSSASLMM